MARLQAQILDADAPPVVAATRIDEADMRRRYGDEVFAICRAELDQKALDAAGADKLNAKLESIWPQLRSELKAFTVPVETMRSALARARGATTATELGLDVGFYREAVRHAREIRKRYSALDLAADAGRLDEFAAGEN